MKTFIIVLLMAILAVGFLGGCGKSYPTAPQSGEKTDQLENMGGKLKISLTKSPYSDQQVLAGARNVKIAEFLVRTTGARIDEIVVDNLDPSLLKNLKVRNNTEAVTVTKVDPDARNILIVTADLKQKGNDPLLLAVYADIRVGVTGSFKSRITIKGTIGNSGKITLSEAVDMQTIVIN